MKRRIVSGFLTMVLSLSLSVTTFAADIPKVAAENQTIAEGTENKVAQTEETDTKTEVQDKETETGEPQNSNKEVEGEVVNQKATDDTTDSTNEKDIVAAVSETASVWTAEDFTYTTMEQRLNGCDYTRDFTIKGTAISGFSEMGAEKIKTNKNLVIPSKDTNGTIIVGVADNAFKNQGIKTLKLPEGMMVDYDDTVTNVVTRRGNFLIGASAFYGNELTSLVLPEGVIYIGPSSFGKNQLSYLSIPHTFWWLENSAFAYNNLSSVDFPKTCDFQAQIHAFAFAHNNIKSVRLPDYMEVVEKKSFYWNPGMEECSTDAPANEQEFGGVVYMYTDNANLFNMERIHHVDRTADSQHSWHQKLVLGDDPNADQSWSVKDFNIEGTVIKGLSESGIEKRKTDRNLVIPDKNGNGEWITEIADSTNTYGAFGAEKEGFEKVTLPAHLERIGNKAFSNNGIKSVEFPGTLKTIGLAAFQQNQLATIVLPDSVTTLGGGAFGSNATIEKVILSKGLSEITAGAFGCSDAKNYMTNFTEITIPNGIEKIGNNAFAGNNFTTIVIPEGVKSIGDYAFSTKEYLSGETTVTLPEGLEKIGKYAFRNKTIKEVELPTTVKALPVNTFSKVYSSGAQAIKTKVFVKTEEQYKDKTNFPASEFHRLVLKTPETEKQWNAEDFVYGPIEAELYPAHETDQKVKITGTGIIGLSEDGEKKLEVNTNLVIPAEDYDGNKIIGIGTKAFLKKGITSVTFPKGVMADYSGNSIENRGGDSQRGNFIILDSAFLGNAITSLELPEGVIYVGGSAFNGNKIKSVSMSHTIWWIASQAFAKNELTTVAFPKTCDFKLNIDNMAFAQNQIKAVRLPDRTEKVTNTAFFQNTGMEPVSDSAPNANYKKGGVVYMYNENVDLKSESFVTHIEGTGTGMGASGTKSWVQKILNEAMPAELQAWNSIHFTFDGTSINGFSDAGKAKLAGDTEVVLPSVNTAGEVVTAIGNSAFAASAMTKVTIPDTIKNIGMTAFRATSLTEVVLPDSVEALGSGAFTSCEKLSSITLSPKLKEISPSAFNFTALKEVTIPEGVTTIGRMAFRNTPITSLKLASTVTKIDQQAFMGNQLIEIDIPGSVKSIGKSAFSQNVEGEGFTSTLTKVTLHEGLTEILSSAFDKTLLTKVDIPSTLTKLDQDAFKSGQNGQVKLFTSNKAHLETTKDFVSESTGHKVFYDEVIGSGWSHADFTYDGGKITGWSAQGSQTRLKNKNLVIPSINPETLEAITEIGDGAFQIPDGEWEQGKDSVESPNGMETVVFPNTLKVIGETAFRYNNFKTLDFPASLTTVKTSAFNSNKLEKLVLPDTITEVQGGAFSTNNITALTLSKGMTKIEPGVFSMNIRLSHVDIPDTITEIGEMAFAGARLETLDIPSSVTKIGRKAFHLHHLSKLTIPGTVKEIGESAFEGTFKAITLKELVIEEGVESIGKYAFKEGYLESVTIPDSIKSLAVDAFYGNAGTNNDHIVVLKTSNPDQMEFAVDATCQKFVFEANWTVDCFTYGGSARAAGNKAYDSTVITGFSEKGLKYLKYTTEVVFPDKNADGAYITAIAAKAFKGYGLTKITLPSQLKVIEEEAFADNNLEKVTLPNTIENVAENAFDATVVVDREETPKPTPTPGENGGNGDGSGTGGNGQNNDTGADGDTKAVMTGDSTPIIALGAAAMLSIVIMAVFLRKKRNV